MTAVDVEEWVGIARQRALDDYGALVGLSVHHLPTPTLVLDRAALDRNLERMQAAVDATDVRLRPHVKTHKSADIARRQCEHGSPGFCAATMWEAAMLVGAGLDDVFVVNAVVGPRQLELLADLARDHRIEVAVDDPAQVDLLQTAARGAGARIGVLVELDTGMRRGGVGSADAAVRLARAVDDAAHLDLRGVTGYEGHCSVEDDPVRRRQLHEAAMRDLVGTADAVRAASLPCDLVSAGGTRTWSWTASTPGVNEIQAGTYALMDRFHADADGGFEPAVWIAATVIHSHGDRFVVDVGSKTVAGSDSAELMHHDVANLGFDEEHGRFSPGPSWRPPVGTALRVLPGYVPTTINVFDVYAVVEDDVVVDVWPIFPRTPEAHGLGAGARA